MTWTDEQAIADSVLADLRVEVDNDSDDATLADFIEKATAMLGERYDMPPVPAVTEARIEFVNGGNLIFLCDCTAVTAVTDPDGNALTYTTTTENGHVTRVELRNARTGRVTVTGTWGAATLPADVQQAVVAQAAMMYRRQKRGTENGYVGRLDAISKEAADIMDARRVRSL